MSGESWSRLKGWKREKREGRGWKRFFRVSRRFEILKRAATASGDMALVHTQHVLYAASPAFDVEKKRERERERKRKKRRKEGRKEKKKGGYDRHWLVVVGECSCTLFLAFHPGFVPLGFYTTAIHHTIASFAFYCRTIRPTYVKCTVFCATYCLFRSNLYPFFLSR